MSINYTVISKTIILLVNFWNVDTAECSSNKHEQHSKLNTLHLSVDDY